MFSKAGECLGTTVDGKISEINTKRKERTILKMTLQENHEKDY
jgi:hypothetical protein